MKTSLTEQVKAIQTVRAFVEKGVSLRKWIKGALDKRVIELEQADVGINDAGATISALSVSLQLYRKALKEEDTDKALNVAVTFFQDLDKALFETDIKF